MEFAGKLSASDLTEVRHLVRSKAYWLKFIVANWYGIALLCALIYGTVLGLMGKTNPSWAAVGVMWGIVGAILVWAWHRTQKAFSKQLYELNATLPDRYSLSSAGLKLDGPNGATTFQPWRRFKGFREGKQVLLLQTSANDQFVILPIRELGQVERQSILQFLRSEIAR